MESTRMDPKAKSWGGFLNKEGKPISSPTKGNTAKRHFFKPNGPETGPTCSPNSGFQSFKNRFSVNCRACRLSRPFTTFSTQLAENYSRSRDPRRGAGLQARIPLTPNSRIYSKSPTVFARGVGKDRLRGCYPTGKRSLEYGQAGFRLVFKQFIFGAQTGRKLSTSHKSKRTECISEIRSFQNGRHSSSSRFVSASRLAGKNRFERRVLRDSSLEGSPEIPSVCLEGFSPRICMPSLWPSGGPKIVHKGVETGGCSSPPSRSTFDNLSGRSFIYESVQRRSRTGHGHSTVSAGKSRFRDQS